MPHGLKRDVTATKKLRANGLLMHSGSFMSLPDSAGIIHLHLEGLDRHIQRGRLYRKAKGKCAVCKRVAPEDRGELHHPGTCDCMDAECPNRIEWRCSQFDSDCHRHRRTGFARRSNLSYSTHIENEVDKYRHGTRKQAVQDFNKLYPPEASA